MIEEKLQEKINKTDRKLVELNLHIQQLNSDYQEYLNEIALNPEELKEFVENSDNFSPDLWTQLHNEKKEMEERLNKELNNVNDAKKTQDAMSERGKVQPHWVFMR